MEKQKNTAETIDEYIASRPAEDRELLLTMSSLIIEAAPEAVPCISYQMPAYRLNRVLVYFAAWKNHIGFYPASRGIIAYERELADYETSKGAIRFPKNQPLPADLIRKIVRLRVKEDEEKAATKHSGRSKAGHQT